MSEDPPEYDDNDNAPIFSVFSVTSPEKLEKETEVVEEAEEYDLESNLSRDGMLKEAVDRAIQMAPNPSIQATMRQTPCFGILWYSEEERSKCDVYADCDLSEVCERVWESVSGGFMANEDVPYVASPPQKRFGRTRKRRKLRKAKKIRMTKKSWGGKTSRSMRVKYVPTGRASDYYAEEIYKVLGKPRLLPDDWSYPHSRTKEDRIKAKTSVIEKYGHEIRVIKRHSYHQYIFEGVYLCKVWVLAAGGCWIDLSHGICRGLVSKNFKHLKRTPESGRTTKYRFYPYRFFISDNHDLKRIKKALTSYPKLSYLNKDVDEPGGSE